jgi:hypothetical protein
MALNIAQSFGRSVWTERLGGRRINRGTIGHRLEIPLEALSVGNTSATLTFARHKHNPAMKRYRRLAVVVYGRQAPDEKLMAHDQDVIDGYWQEAVSYRPCSIFDLSTDI